MRNLSINSVPTTFIILAVKILYLVQEPKVGTKLEHERREVVPNAVVEYRQNAINHVKNTIAA